jgi:excisionase family DNA binding protein
MLQVPAPSQPAPEYLSVAEAAQRLRVDRKTIHRALADRTLPCVRLGRVIRIPTSALGSPSKST